MVVIDLLVLIIFTGVVSGLNLSLVQVVPHRENRQTVTGVRVQLIESNCTGGCTQLVEVYFKIVYMTL